LSVAAVFSGVTPIGSWYPFKFFAAVAIALLLASCAQQPMRDAAPRPARDSIDSYVLEGRVSVRRGDEARQASLNWQHSKARDQIELSGPLGQKAARLTRDASGARLDTASRETVTASDWSTLSERVLGVELPLDGMARWVVAAVPANSKGAQTERDAAGRPLQAMVDGWHIAYLAYESDAPEALPTLIELHRDDINVRLKIDQWQIGPPD
jgi:outer membrane lipoprotein LolB